MRQYIMSIFSAYYLHVEKTSCLQTSIISTLIEKPGMLLHAILSEFHRDARQCDTMEPHSREAGRCSWTTVNITYWQSDDRDNAFVSE